MDESTRLAFLTPWDECTPEQQELRRKHLPEKPVHDYDQVLIDRYKAGLFLSVSDKCKARKLLQGSLNY